MDRKKGFPLPGKLSETLAKYRRYLRLAGADEIARRYFVMNAFDGALTVMGIVLGAYIAGVESCSIIVSAVLGASLAMGLSGVWGAYMAEKAERLRKIKDLEAALFTNLRGSRLYQASVVTIVWLAIVDGASPVAISLLAVSPFLLQSFKIFSLEVAVYLSVSLTLAILFILGMFLGRISKESLIVNGVKMASAGAVIAFILLFIQGVL